MDWSAASASRGSVGTTELVKDGDETSAADADAVAEGHDILTMQVISQMSPSRTTAVHVGAHCKH